MPDVFRDVVANGPPITARDALVRLIGAMVLGWIVAWVYGRTRPAGTSARSFRATLVLLAGLIAMVTQVIGNINNDIAIARSFSLVGALSIVRFRTVVQDTQDTAFVIFAVVMGMAAGANEVWISIIGLGVVSATAFLMKPTDVSAVTPALGFVLTLRVGLGHDIDALVRGPLAAHVSTHRLVSMETARQGTAIEASYQVEFRVDGSPEGLLNVLNRTEGVQNVHLQGLDDDEGRRDTAT